MDTVLNYMTTQVITMNENNIKQPMIEYVERFVNVRWEKKETTDIINGLMQTSKERQEAVKAFHLQLRMITNDLVNPGQPMTADLLYREWITAKRRNVMPQRKLKKKNVYDDITRSPQDYLPHMFYMMTFVESRGASVFNACPLRTAIIPKHFRLDTASLIKLCFAKGDNKSFYVGRGNLVTYKDDIWSKFFKTHRKCFHARRDGHAYTFDHQMVTDGVSCRILLKRKDIGEPVKKKTAEQALR